MQSALVSESFWIKALIPFIHKVLLCWCLYLLLLSVAQRHTRGARLLYKFLWKIKKINILPLKVPKREGGKDAPHGYMLLTNDNIHCSVQYHVPV